jgi:hypothetical protein
VRFVLAIVSFVLALVLMGWGIAQRTVWAGPASIDAAGATTGDAPVTVIDGSVFNAYAGNPTLTAQSDGLIFAAYGRTTDVLAWVGDASYNEIGIDSETGALTTDVVQGTETEVPDPTGSDLWLEEFAGERSLHAAVGIPAEVSVILISDGVAPPPADLQISWPLDNSTPFATPLMIGGGVVLLIGVGFLLWAINGMRRSRGPRRKTPKPPKELRKRYKPTSRKPAREGPKGLEAPATGRRSAARGMIAFPVLLVGALVLAGCTAGPTPGLSAAPNPSASSAQDALALPPPAVTERQVSRIVGEIVQVATDADAAMDKTLLATRFAGPALLQRETDYTVRTNDPSIGANVPAIPNADVLVTLPQQTETWPRVVMVVIGDASDTTIAPVALVLHQDSAREDYKVYYAITLEPSMRLPDVAPANVGASRLPGATGILKIEPDSLALAYGDVLAKDVESGNYLDFESEGDSLRVSIRDAKAGEAANLAATAAISFTQALGSGEAIALATNAAGAIVAVELNDITTVTPVEAGAAVNPSGRVKALTGLSISTRGVTATYQVQLLFAVPPVGSGDKIVLLGYSYGLVAATEVG